MWFYIGIISLLATFAYRLYRNLQWAWGWSDEKGHLKIDGRPYKVKHSENKGSHTFEFAVVCPAKLYFRLKRETKWDRFAKKIGVSVEQQVNDPHFDEALYIVSDDPLLIGELREIAPLRTVVKTLFNDQNLKSLYCEGRHLVVRIEVKGDMAALKYQKADYLSLTIPALHQIAKSLDFLASQSGPKWRDKFAIRAALLVSISSSLLIVGGLEMLRVVRFERGTVMLDGWQLFVFSAAIAIAILFLLQVITAAWLRGSSHAHIVMLEILISGGLGLLMGGYVLTRDINCEWDKYSAHSFVVEVTGKHTGYRRKQGTYYVLNLNNSTTPIPDSIEVDSVTYNNSSIGGRLIFNIKPGFLGYRWIESIAPL